MGRRLGQHKEADHLLAQIELLKDELFSVRKAYGECIHELRSFVSMVCGGRECTLCNDSLQRIEDGVCKWRRARDILDSYRMGETRQEYNERDPLKPLDETGFVFLDACGRPYRCCMYRDTPWLFYWHQEGKWVTLRQVDQMDVWMFPRNLTPDQQEYYNREHERKMGAVSWATTKVEEEG